MRQLSGIVLVALLGAVVLLLLPGIGVIRSGPAAQEEEVVKFSQVARKIFTPKCALHY